MTGNVVYERTVPSHAEVEAALKVYAARQRRARDARYQAERRANLRATKRNPPRIEWAPPPAKAPDFRVALDARIDTCPGCDQWRFDRACQGCLTAHAPRGTAA